MCHTFTSVTRYAIDAGGDWQCARCGQHWDATRLAAVARYATWVAERDGLGGRGTENSQDRAPYRDSSTNGWAAPGDVRHDALENQR
jgi:hypothetical protein